jgi:UDP-N-acetylglucosamine diphosphorylase / glucose-1-phosphate thymidylyltransferase / UDP-N-acetylgalactosamine diphosphorylase / glucosamine-1-phosphate N-acetyltransferase / galactosamine-1-phosphate N-acetyltransferase
MRLVLFDRLTPQRRNFYPLALSRPIWDLLCGISLLSDKIEFATRPAQTALWMPDYLADVYRRETEMAIGPDGTLVRAPLPINDPHSLAGDDLLLVAATVKAEAVRPFTAGPSRVAKDVNGEIVLARILKEDLAKLAAGTLETLLSTAQSQLPAEPGGPLPTWNYLWELVLANGRQIAEDFRAFGRGAIEGAVEEPCAIRGSRDDIYIGHGTKIHPMVVLDAEHGPIYIDDCAEIHPFTRIEGPCYIGGGSILLGAKCREGNSIGPMCRIGGEVEGSIIQGYSNKYHDGFLGHAYVGQWVNLGALTTNSDLKNDYSEVKITLDGRTQIATGSGKVGALIGDHAKTSIGTLLNTGAYVGAMSVLVAGGRLMPKFIPSFAWYLNDIISHGAGKASLYATARTAMSRRGCQWTECDEAMWDAVYEMTAPEREEAVEEYRKKR